MIAHKIVNGTRYNLLIEGCVSDLLEISVEERRTLGIDVDLVDVLQNRAYISIDAFGQEFQDYTTKHGYLYYQIYVYTVAGTKLWHRMELRRDNVVETLDFDEQ